MNYISQPGAISLMHGGDSMDSNRDMVMKKGGQMIMLIGGGMRVMETEVVAADGTRIGTDGAMILPDGRTHMMMDDEAMVIDVAMTRLMET
jgi:hypothetical protein